MTAQLDDLAQALLAHAKRAGADAADTLALSATSVSVDVRNGVLEEAQRAEATDVNLRVFVGQRSASVSSSDTRDAALATIAERAVAMARVAPEDPYVGLADPAQLATDTDAARLELHDTAPEPSAAELEEDARRAEAAALAVAGVTRMDGCGAGYSAQNICFAASNGFAGGLRRTSRALSCVAIAGEGTGMERDYDGDSRIFQSDLRAPEDIGRRAGERTVERLNPRKPRTGAYPVIFDERVSSSLVHHLLSAVNGSAIARGASWLRDAMGEAVLPKGLDLIEDPHRVRVPGSRLFDAEGLPTARRAIVEDGVLQSWTLDLATGRKLGLPSTANAGRSGGGSISPTTWNIALTQGTASRADLIAEMNTGLVVTSMIGSTINPNTGDYSRGAAGFWVENGEIAYPVSGVTIAGNLRDFLKTVRPANDARPWLSTVVPSLLVEGLTLAGE